MLKLRFLILVSLIFCLSCKKDEKEPVNQIDPNTTGGNGSVKLHFRNTVNDADLVFNQDYKTLAGDSFRVTKFNYYVSNVVLSGTTTYAIPESYFIIRHPAQLESVFASIPSGTYTSIQFMLGVDSARNCSGVQSGGLDPAYATDMYWSWNSGYIFLKFEGSSPKSGAGNKSLLYHIGGFKGDYRAQRTMYFSLLNAPLVITGSKQASVNIQCDLNRIFTGASNVDFSTVYNVVNPSPPVKLLADNYKSMMSVISVTTQP